MQYSAEAWMQGVPLNYGDVQRYAHLAPPGEAGIAGWSAPTMPPDLPGAYLQQAYMPMPDYRQAAAAAGLGAYPPLFDYAQLTEAQLAAHLSSSQPSLAPPTTAAPQLLSVNHRSKLALNPHRPLHPTDPADEDDEPCSLLAAAGEPLNAELPSSAVPPHYLNKASLHLAAAAGQLPYPPSLQQFRPYPQLRHPPPALVPYHPYPYATALSQPQDFDDAPHHDPAVGTPPAVLPSLQPSLSRPGPSNAEVAQQLGDDIADHFVRVERKITCPTYCKRLHVTQFMAENLLPTDQTKDRAKGPLCYNYELLFKHKVWLIDEDLVSWPVEYEGVVCCAQRHYRLTSGWRNFVRAKNIKVGDTVVMERRGRNRHNVYVKVVEGNATPATPPKAKAPRMKASLARNDDTLEAPDAALASP